MPASQIESTISFLLSGTATLKALTLLFVFSSTMSDKARLDPVELLICALKRLRVHDGSKLAIYKYALLTVWGTFGNGPLFGVEAGSCVGEGSDLVLGAGTGGLALAGVTTTLFLSFPSPVIWESLVASVRVVIGFKSLFSSDSLGERLGMVHCSITEHLWSRAAIFCSSRSVLQVLLQPGLPAASASICLYVATSCSNVATFCSSSATLVGLADLTQFEQPGTVATLASMIVTSSVVCAKERRFVSTSDGVDFCEM